MHRPCTYNMYIYNPLLIHFYIQLLFWRIHEAGKKRKITFFFSKYDLNRVIASSSHCKKQENCGAWGKIRRLRALSRMTWKGAASSRQSTFPSAVWSVRGGEVPVQLTPGPGGCVWCVNLTSPNRLHLPSLCLLSAFSGKGQGPQGQGCHVCLLWALVESN